MKTYDDFIVGDFIDSYEALTLKTLTSYTYFQVWSAWRHEWFMTSFFQQSCDAEKTKWVVMNDDDTFVDQLKLDNFISSLPENSGKLHFSAYTSKVRKHTSDADFHQCLALKWSVINNNSFYFTINYNQAFGDKTGFLSWIHKFEKGKSKSERVSEKEREWATPPTSKHGRTSGPQTISDHHLRTWK